MVAWSAAVSDGAAEGLIESVDVNDKMRIDTFRKNHYLAFS